jgi:GR25 family glycosyltransferase involved in LPS biosynthesis
MSKKEKLKTSIINTSLEVLQESMSKGDTYCGINEDDILETKLQMEALNEGTAEMKNKSLNKIKDAVLEIRLNDILMTIERTFSTFNESNGLTSERCYHSLKNTIPLASVAIYSDGHVKDKINGFIKVIDLCNREKRRCHYIADCASKLIKLSYFTGGNREYLMNNDDLIALITMIMHQVIKRDKRVMVDDNKLLPKIQELVKEYKAE